MKQLAAIAAFLLLFCLLLAGCGAGEAAAPEVEASRETAAPETREGAALVGSWENRGQYSQGRDFVETMILEENGTARIHLDYQGEPYADLEGQWLARNGELLVTFRGDDARDRSYSYAVRDGVLTLTGDGKEVTYQRVH